MRVAVWGSGNMGRAAIRAVVAHPALELTGVVSRSRAGEDAGTLAGLQPLGVLASPDLAEADAVAYMASGDLRPDEAAADIARCLRAGAVVVTPSLYSQQIEAKTDSVSEVSPAQVAESLGGGLSLSVSASVSIF